MRGHLLSLLVVVLLAVVPAMGQGIEPANRPIAEVRIQGLKHVPEQLVRNSIRSKAGEPYDPRTVNRDIVRLTHLGRFSEIRAEVTPKKDGSVILTFVVQEQALITDVQVVGNKALSDQKLLGKVLLQAGDPVDPYLIEQGRREILKAYQDEGYFVADVTVEQKPLDTQHILIYQVREGPKVRIADIRFSGNKTFTGDQLDAQIKSHAYVFIFHAGNLNREDLDLDAARLRDFYHDRGYLDAQVGRRIDLSPDQQRAVVTFLIQEGKRYTVADIRVAGAKLFPAQQILIDMTIHRGAVYSANEVAKSVDAIQDLYGKLGFLDTKVRVDKLFHADEPKVDLVVHVDEGTSALVGTLTLRGNELTQDKVILRDVRGMRPGRPFDRTGVADTRQRLNESPFFANANITILGQPGDKVRDVLIDVKEKSTGSVSFGAGISSDLGVIGAVDLTQRNFDITDWPDSFGEFISGRAFRGAGQFFNLTLQPGNETSRYAVSFRDPYVFESDYSFKSSLALYSRIQDSYDEQRFGGTLGVGHRFGDVWSASVSLRATTVTLDNLDDDAPNAVFDQRGKHFLTGLGFGVTRNTTDSRIFPTQGSSSELTVERVGLLGGDYDFTRLTGSFVQYWTVDEDFFGRRTVLSLRTQLGYIPEGIGDTPVFERFYAGGHRSFRGFDYRGVGPRGVRHDSGTLGDTAVGGTWEALASLEYNFPLIKDSLRGVIFSDMGTIQDRVGLDNWRVSVGAGIRIKIPFLGRAPFALDFAVPLVKEDGDQTRIISFDLAVPFQ